MFIYDFNRGADNIDIISDAADPTHLLNEMRMRITRGRIPSPEERLNGEVYAYIPEETGTIEVEHESGLLVVSAPGVLVLAPQCDVDITFQGSTDHLYAIEPLNLPVDAVDEERIESQPEIVMDREGGIAYYPRESRYFEVNGEIKESGWYVHSLKDLPDGLAGVIGVADAHWPQGVRDDEIVHCHPKSLEALIVLSGAATILCHVDGKPYSFRQEPGVLTAPDPTELHGILEVEDDYHHLVVQAPSRFHDPDERYVFKGAQFETGRTKEYVVAYGIPEALGGE